MIKNTVIPKLFKGIPISSTNIVDSIFDYHQKQKLYIDEKLEYSYMLQIKKLKVQLYFKERLKAYRQEFAKVNVPIKYNVEVKEKSDVKGVQKVETQPKSSKKNNKKKSKKEKKENKNVDKTYSPLDAKVLVWSKNDHLKHEPMPWIEHKHRKSNSNKVNPDNQTPDLSFSTPGQPIKLNDLVKLNLSFRQINEISQTDFVLCLIYKGKAHEYVLDFYKSSKPTTKIRSYDPQTICIKKTSNSYYICNEYIHKLNTLKTKKPSADTKGNIKTHFVKFVSTPMGGSNKKY